MDSNRGLASSVAVAGALLLAGIVWGAVPAARAALAYRAPRLLELYAAVAGLIALSGVLLFVALRRRRAPFGWGSIALLLIFGAMSAATGVSPGSVFQSPEGALAFVVVLAGIAGVIGSARDRGLGCIAAFGTLFAGAGAAAFMVGWAPVIASLIVR